MKYLRLKQLMNDVMGSLPVPHTEDVIEDVFVAIEANPVWRKTYDEMVYQSGKAAVNAWAGFWISHAEGRTVEERRTAARTSLIESYSRLVPPAAKKRKKVKEPEALKVMHEHFLSQREALPATIRDHRDVILALIMDGLEPDVAFSKALEKPAFAW